MIKNKVIDYINNVITSPYRKILVIAFIAIAIANCHPSASYLMLIQSSMRSVEREDHQKCIAQGIDFGDWNDVSTEIYWRCRRNLVDFRFIHDATSVADIKNNAMIKKIRKKIMKNLDRARQTILSEVEHDVETFDHSKCLSMGYNLDSNNQDNNIQYYECRKNLIFERVAPAPVITNSYAAAVLPDDKFDQYLEGARRNKVIKGEVDFANRSRSRYPRCSYINVKSKFFNQCVIAQNASVKCLDKIANLKAKKQLDDKIYCQRQAFVQFPDNYSLTRNKSAKEIEKIIKEEREAETARLKQEKEERINRTLKFFEEGHVSKNKIFKDDYKKESKEAKEALYDKIQILELREEFIMKCNELMQKKLPDYIDERTNKCVAIGKNWDKKEKSDF